MRLAGILILSVTTVFSGFYVALRAQKRVELLECCIRLIRSFSVDIGYCNEPVSVMIKKSSERNELSSLSFLQELSEADVTNFAFEWKKSIEKFSLKSELNKSDIQLLESFGEKLGTTDCSYQTQLCDEYVKRFEERYESAHARLPEHMRICRVSGGVMAAVLLIILL